MKGLPLSSDIEAIPNRFFIHNENIDFFIAAKKYTDKKLNEMAKKLIQKEVKISRILEKIYFGEANYDYYRTDIIFDNFTK